MKQRRTVISPAATGSLFSNVLLLLGRTFALNLTELNERKSFGCLCFYTQQNGWRGTAKQQSAIGVCSVWVWDNTPCAYEVRSSPPLSPMLGGQIALPLLCKCCELWSLLLPWARGLHSNTHNEASNMLHGVCGMSTKSMCCSFF